MKIKQTFDPHSHRMQFVFACWLGVLHNARWKPRHAEHVTVLSWTRVEVKAVSRSPCGGLLVQLIREGGGSGDGLGGCGGVIGVRNGAVETKA